MLWLLNGDNMKVLISGHRTEKLEQYNIDCIKILVQASLEGLREEYGYLIGLSGMANGIDLMFCDLCRELDIRYYACIPFEEQHEYMSTDEVTHRDELIKKAEKKYLIRNSEMLNMAKAGIIVWDGNKGGTHNVFQQMLESGKPFVWIEPKSLKIYRIGC